MAHQTSLLNCFFVFGSHSVKNNDNGDDASGDYDGDDADGGGDSDGGDDSDSSDADGGDAGGDGNDDGKDADRDEERYPADLKDLCPSKWLVASLLALKQSGVHHIKRTINKLRSSM